MSRSTPRARKSKSVAAANPPPIPRDETPEAAAARKRAYKDANRIAKRYIIPALILVPVLLFLIFYKLYGNGSPAVAPRGFNQQQQQQQQRPVWTAPTTDKNEVKKASKKKPTVKEEDKPVDGSNVAGGRGAETKMDQKQTEEFARLMMEQLAKLAKGNNPDLKLTFNNEEINLGGGSAKAETAGEGAEKKAEGGDVDAAVFADEEIDLE